MNLLSIDGLSIARRGHPTPLVADFSMSIAPGEVVALVGESGSGKSIISLSILGLLPSALEIRAGSIGFSGRDLTGLTSREMRRIRGAAISVVFQEPMTSMNPVMRIGAQIVEAIRLHESVSERAALARAEMLLKRVKFRNPRGALHLFPHQLSGGMRQRALIAMALACRPQMLIADEPTTALDVTVQAQILDLLMSIRQEENLSILFVSHNLAAVRAVADRVVVLYRGRKMEEGEASDLIDHPRHPYTAALLAAIPEVRPGLPPEALPWLVETKEGQATELGCLFAPRCITASDECNAEPELTIHENRLLRCWHPMIEGPDEQNVQ